MTDKTVAVSLTTVPVKDYSFSLSIPGAFAPDPDHKVALPEGNEAHIFRYEWLKISDGNRFTVQGWRIEYHGPYFAGKDEPGHVEIMQAYHVGAYLRKQSKAILEALRNEERGDEEEGEGKAAAAPSRFPRKRPSF